LLGWGKDFWPTPGASARAGALMAQRRPTSEGETARACGGDDVAAGPLASESGGGNDATGLTVRANRPSGGGGTPAAGGLDGGLPPVARFLAHGEVA
jgi:hypothetical protein